MKKSFFLLQLLVFLMVGLAAFAQTVTGVVMSEDGPLPGATIIIKGTTQGTTSDFDGNFSINADADAVLQVSFVGFVSQDFPVNNQQNITIMLASDNALDEVVVTTGYGTQSKRDITGAVSTIEAKDLTAVPATTFSQQMQGRASGISIVSDVTQGEKQPFEFAGLVQQGITIHCM